PREARERGLLVDRAMRTAGHERVRKRRVLQLRAAFEHECPLLAIDAKDLARAVARRRVDGLCARPELVLLRRVAERERERALLRLRAAGELEPADRLGILEELVRRHLDPV